MCSFKHNLNNPVRKLCDKLINRSLNHIVCYSYLKIGEAFEYIIVSLPVVVYNKYKWHKRCISLLENSEYEINFTIFSRRNKIEARREANTTDYFARSSCHP